MDKQRLTALIITSGFSIIALIGLQLYWINLSLESQREQFDQRVMTCMHAVIQKLEKEEAITKVTSQLIDDSGLEGMQGDSLVNLGSFALSGGMNESELDQEPAFANISGDRFKLNIELPNPKRNDSSTFIMRETQKRVINSRVSSPAPGDSLMKNQLRRKATLINEIVNELAFIRISNNFNERVDSTQIDSLFEHELQLAGIKTPFIFDILDAESGRLTFNPTNTDSDQIAKSKYKLELFPNDYFIKSDSLLLYFPNRQGFLWLSSWRILLLSLLIVTILTSVIYKSFSTIFRQKRLSQVKNDFINNMTHELKTPISTISLACEALSDKSLAIEEERKGHYIEMIQDENQRLSLLVDNVLKSAVWDSASMSLKIQRTELHPLIEKVVDSFRIQIEKKGGVLNSELNATNDLAEVDEVHFTNIVFNLLDNANKYSRETPEITIRTKNQNSGFQLSVEDRGIGISKEDQSKIFDKFYRVPTGNIHEVKGFGLGLNYVKRIVDQLNGDVQLRSKKGVGTTITIFLKQND